MATAPTVIVAGHPSLARKLRNTGRFPAVFAVTSATALRELSRSGRVTAPATFLFGPGFDEDIPDADVTVLANGLAANGFTVLVHSAFSERGDVFDPQVIADAGPLTMAQLLDLLTGAGAPPEPPQERPSEQPPPRRELINEPPAASWAAPAEEPPPVREAEQDEQDGLSEYEAPDGDAEHGDENASEEHEEEAFQDVLVARGPGPAESPREEAPPDDEHEQPDLAETLAELLPFAPGESGAEPPFLDERMWKESAPEPDHHAGLPLETDHEAAMPSGPDGQDEPPPAPEPAPAPARHPVAGPRRRGTIMLMAAAAFVLLAGLTAGAGLALGQGKEERHPETAASTAPSPDPSTPASSGGTSRTPTPTSTAVRPAERFRPTGVRIVDSRISIEVSWKDASGGKAAYYVVGGPPGQPPSTLANTEQGATKAEVIALNPSVEYCLTVVAVMDVDRVAHAEPVCTHRGKRKG